MTSSTYSANRSLTGSCPCSSVSWTSSISPSSICICHCSDCRSSSPTKLSVPFAFFPNHAIQFANHELSTNTTEPGTSNITHKEEKLAVRGSCKLCASLIYMKYHSSAGETDVNMALCDDQSVVEKLQETTIHIFCEEKEEVAQGQRGWRGFSDEQRRNLDKWDLEGRKKRTDVYM